MSLFIGPPSHWLALVWGWDGNVRGLLLAGMAVASERRAAFPWFPQAGLKLTLG